MWALLLVPVASATPCEEALSLLADGVDASAVAEVARARPFDDAQLGCLADGGAPRRVVVGAARGSGLQVPADPEPRRWELALGPVGFVDGGIRSPVGGDLHLAFRPVPLVAIDAGAAVGVGDPGPDAVVLRDVALDPGPVSLEFAVRHLSRLTVQLAPIQGTVQAGRSSLALRGYGLVGFGAIRTVDDPRGLLGLEQDDRFVATEVQTHPTLHWGGGLGLDGPRALGLRFQVEQARWIETLQAVTLESRQLVAMSAALTVRP